MSTATRITVEQYEDMIERGEFEPREKHHVELIRGEIVPKKPGGPMSPTNASHVNAVIELTEWSFEVIPRGLLRVSVQSPLRIDALDSEPEPDLAWLARRNFRVSLPTPADVLLVIEVSDSSLSIDRGVKAALYAEAGIQDYWIVNIPGRCVEVRRDPQGSSYRDVTTFAPGSEVRPLILPEAVLAVDRLFSDDRE